MARGWKRVAELLAARSGLPGALRLANAPSTVVLAYHNIVPRGEKAAGDLSLHVDQSAFGDQLDLLLETHDVIGLDEIFLPRSSRDRSRRAVITFDDAYEGTMTAGVEEVSRRGLPATVFVPPGLLGSSGFWWDRLAPAGGGPLDPEVRSHALGELRGRAERIFDWAHRIGRTINEVPSHACPVAQDFEWSSLPGGIRLGAHTWSHANLESLPRGEVEDELRESRSWLASRTDRYVDWLAYPYGLHDEMVAEAAGELFDGALLIDGGFAEKRGQRTPSRQLVPRLNVPRGVSLDGLALRLAGMLG